MSMQKKRAVVLGAGGFIGSHLVERLKSEGYFVRGVDRKLPEFSETRADEFQVVDLRDASTAHQALQGGFDEAYQLAAEMGGAGFIFTGENDAEVFRNSALMNLNVVEAVRLGGIPRVFFSSSACVYPKNKQADPDHPDCSEDSAYPAAPDSEYGWEKLFGERLYEIYRKNFGLGIRVGRLHNVFGPRGTWRGGREKAPAAICRKVAEARNGESIEIWGDGKQTRSFLFVDEGIEGIRRLMSSDITEPLNIGSEEMISINEFARMVVGISGKDITLRHIQGPTGVRGRVSDNRRIRETLGWAPSRPLKAGVESLYRWVATQVGAVGTVQENP